MNVLTRGVMIMMILVLLPWLLGSIKLKWPCEKEQSYLQLQIFSQGQIFWHYLLSTYQHFDRNEIDLVLIASLNFKKLHINLRKKMLKICII